MTVNTINKSKTQMTAEIVAAYVGNQKLSVAKVPELIKSVHDAIALLAEAGEGAQAAPAPAVPVAKSVARGHVVCLEDGLKFKSLKRHLRIAHRMSATEYRSKWGLSKDYPMVAPAYSAKRSEIAKQIHLGQKVEAEARRAVRKVGRRSEALDKAA